MAAAIAITGASTGIGLACVRRFAGAGWHVFAGVRREMDAERLQAVYRHAVTPLLLDVTRPEQIAAAAAQMEEALQTTPLEEVAAGAVGLGALINNAGIAVPGPLEILPLEELRRQLEVNTVGQLAVTQALLPLLRRNPTPATIVNISSASGRFAFPVVGAYAASKFALEAMNDALRVELRPWGIRVVSVQPGAVATPIWAKTLETGGRMIDAIPESTRAPYQPLIDAVRARTKPEAGISTDRVVHVIFRAIRSRHPRARYVVGWDARFILLLSHLPAFLRDWLVTRSLPRYGR